MRCSKPRLGDLGDAEPPFFIEPATGGGIPGEVADMVFSSIMND
jgi:hypothetical protein